MSNHYHYHPYFWGFLTLVWGVCCVGKLVTDRSAVLLIILYGLVTIVSAFNTVKQYQYYQQEKKARKQQQESGKKS